LKNILFQGIREEKVEGSIKTETLPIKTLISFKKHGVTVFITVVTTSQKYIENRNQLMFTN